MPSQTVAAARPKTAAAKARLEFLRAELSAFIGPYDVNKAGLANFHMLDVRSDASWAKGRIAGARHIPRAELATRLNEVPRDRDVVVYCGDITCFSSKKAAVALLEAGFERIQVLFGGFESWKDHAYATEGGRAANG